MKHEGKCVEAGWVIFFPFEEQKQSSFHTCYDYYWISVEWIDVIL